VSEQYAQIVPEFPLILWIHGNQLLKVLMQINNAGRCHVQSGFINQFHVQFLMHSVIPTPAWHVCQILECLIRDPLYRLKML
jgi:hypothetical protein